MTASTFKERYINYTKSFNDRKYANETELSNYVSYLKEKNKSRLYKKVVKVNYS